MRARDIELWALQIINRLKNNQPVEDSRVELKGEWPSDTARAARRIAGHANAARGEDILWLIGVDEKQRLIIGAIPTELATWWSQVKAQFDELTPDLIDVAVPADGLTIVALCFTTDRAPYVVKHSQDQVSREIPWRDGTSIRSAKRSEILSIFADVPQVPDIQILGIELEVFPQRNDGKGHWGNVRIHLYVRPRSKQQVVLPLHGRDLSIRLLTPTAVPIPCRFWWFSTQAPDSFTSEVVQYQNLASATIHVRDSDLVINGPGSLYVAGDFDHVLLPEGYENMNVQVQLTISDASFLDPIVLQADVVRGPFIAPGDIDAAYWRLPTQQGRY